MTVPLALDVQALVAGAGAEPVLRGLDLALPAGARAALLGASGSGKSTLLRAIAGLLRPRAGSIRIAGRLVADATTAVAPAQRGVAMAFQSYALWPHLTAREQLRLVAGDAARADLWLERARIAPLAKRLPGELSGGEQARLALARAFASGASLLLLDEPLKNLDPPLAAELRVELVEWIVAASATALIVSHDPREAAAIATSMHLLIDGRIAACGAPEELLANPPDEAAARLLGLRLAAPRGRAEAVR
ncbi:MAG: ABC transporter ATP-binding protein [Planctomycetes bacterium]|nr:ABC transporter ATP-binding protein [Planctomycetota bacterium]